ncbi:hypothetical protein D8674_029054 [Pyrus ussuriensis x Pyrus communis]|uniref:Uncharacterized protein n=1 Tax=Pyrus ussuriensis x Pyrus communis TaxID=2448454 RepID=A0A5N5I105_9ROSA|nr:hypothetical protein D8674_029054 [Pyrus ussuriensis x Pyrus communis]
MSGDSKLSRLCRLKYDFLRPYTSEPGVVLVAQDVEVPVTLSQVLRQVKLWTQALDSGSENGVAVGLDCKSDCMCPTKIVTHLGFIRLLCVCMNLAIIVAVSCSSSCSVDGADDLHSGLSMLILALKPKLENADWSTMARVVRVLRDIRKYLKSEDDDELVEAFFDSINSVLSTVPWNLLDEIHVGAKPDVQKGSRADSLFQRSLFLGNLIQFLCSMVEQSGSAEASGGSIDKHHPVFSTFITLVLQLLCWCLGEQAHCINFNECISQYFRHKLLMLMIRLIFQTYPQQSVLVSWLQLVHDYFGELLQQPITPLEYLDDCLEGSPFLSNVSDAEVNSLSSHHLQRQAVFLFVRCSFELDCCARKKGLLELYISASRDDVLFKVLLQLLSVPFCAEEWNMERFRIQRAILLFRVSDIFNPVLLFHLFLLEARCSLFDIYIATHFYLVMFLFFNLRSVVLVGRGERNP